uniref:Large ribosomal subunit protein uL22c n=1 Tax=Nitzschia sp. IriIs04 TaxID=1444690 RepID=A0A0S3QPP3_9STRA|nr:ribosomal protein L22 [Nitzschia sp. IriIs04]BAT70306.1 ribosomal protein L22 [Nitzschia sp. IriIs04]
MKKLKKSTFTIKYIKMSPYKLRRVANQLKNCSYKQALKILEFSSYRAAFPLWKTLNSFVSNIIYQQNIKVDNIFIEQIFINEGPKQKKFRIASRGRIHKILKSTSHITMTLKYNI